MTLSKHLATVLVALALGVILQFGAGGNAVAAEVEFTKEFTENPENLATGKKIWVKQCAKCHGQSAYPGKAPKLKPEKYKIGFVYRRITKGFRGMPSWKKKYNKKKRMSIAAYVKSPGFVQ